MRSDFVDYSPFIQSLSPKSKELIENYEAIKNSLGKPILKHQLVTDRVPLTEFAKYLRDNQNAELIAKFGHLENKKTKETLERMVDEN
jgi:hypothetical protein